LLDSKLRLLKDLGRQDAALELLELVEKAVARRLGRKTSQR